MNQKERMLKELPYKAWLDGLPEERMKIKLKIYENNHLKPHEKKRIDKLIMDIIAVGNPCKVIRKITEEDRKYYYKNYEFDVDNYLL